MSGSSAYLVDMREMEFFLWEQFRIHDRFVGQPSFDRWSVEELKSIVQRAKDFATVLGCEYQTADQEGCELLPDGTVRLPQSFLRLWEEYRREWVFFRGLRSPRDYKPALLPLVKQVIFEMFMGANPAFMTYGGFSVPAAKLVLQSGMDAQQRLFVNKLLSYEWDACFCATEPEAGSDITAIRTMGVANGDGSYRISGEKVFISGGMHQLTENTVYFVLARTPSSTPDSYALSCFLVPKFWIDAERGRLEWNNVECIKLEQKMGFCGCANAHLVFGQTGVTRAYLLGARENIGLFQLRTLMSEARSSTGLFALGMASSAYLHSL